MASEFLLTSTIEIIEPTCVYTTSTQGYLIMKKAVSLFREVLVVLIPTCIAAGIVTHSHTGLLWYWLLYHRTVDSTAVRNVILYTVS